MAYPEHVIPDGRTAEIDVKIGVGSSHAHQAVLLHARTLRRVAVILRWLCPTVVNKTHLLHNVRRRDEAS